MNVSSTKVKKIQQVQSAPAADNNHRHHHFHPAVIAQPPVAASSLYRPDFSAAADTLDKNTSWFGSCLPDAGLTSPSPPPHLPLPPPPTPPPISPPPPLRLQEAKESRHVDVSAAFQALKTLTRLLAAKLNSAFSLEAAFFPT